MAGIERPGGKEVPRERVLTAEEIHSFWAKLDDAVMVEPTRLALKLLLVTGQRRGEITFGKTRATARSVFNRAGKYLQDGTVVLPNSTRHAFLIELLAEAKPELMRRRHRTPRVGEEAYPVLEGLAGAFYKELGLTDVSLIMAVATAVGAGCSQKTAKRYVEQAAP